MHMQLKALVLILGKPYGISRAGDTIDTKEIWLKYLFTLYRVKSIDTEISITGQILASIAYVLFCEL